MTPYGVARKLGGRKVLKESVRSEIELAEAIHRGLPTAAVDAVLASGLLEPGEVYELVVPRRTLTHRRGRRQPLTPEQSDRLARVVRIAARAEEALADPEKAGRWLRQPNRALSGRKPIQLLESDVGARMVERVLTRIEYGIAS